MSYNDIIEYLTLKVRIARDIAFNCKEEDLREMYFYRYDILNNLLSTLKYEEDFKAEYQILKEMLIVNKER